MSRDYLHVATEELFIVRPNRFVWVPHRWGNWLLDYYDGINLVKPRNIYRLTFRGEPNRFDERVVEVDCGEVDAPGFDWIPHLRDRLGDGVLRSLWDHRHCYGRVIIDAVTREPLHETRCRVA